MPAFPPLTEPSVFIAAPGDLGYLRTAASRELEALRRSTGDDHGIQVYDWQIHEAEHGFRNWIAPQEQIPLPSDPNCRAVLCLLGERIGSPLAEDFDTRPIGPAATLQGNGARLVHPWQPGAERDGGFALTGTIFEFLAALHANRQHGGSDTERLAGKPPVLLLVVGDASIRDEPDPLMANWGGQRLFLDAQARLLEKYGEKGFLAPCLAWKTEVYDPQLRQLRNFLRYLESRSVFPDLVADEGQARTAIRDFLASALDLRPGGSERDPFKGLMAYDAEDGAVFFGREAERREAVERLTELWHDAQRPTFYGVVGGSGVGKSSLTRAGIVGHLCHQTSLGDYLACIVRPTELLPEPLPRLLDAALAAIDPACDLAAARAALDETREALQARKALTLITGALAGRGPGWRLILAFDQFEELLDLRAEPAGPALWDPVVDLIGQAVHHPAIGVVYTLQTNRTRLIESDPVLGPLWTQGGTLPVGFPDHSLDEIIRKPFEATGLFELEPELVRALRDRIVRFAQRSDGETSGSLLPLVSLTLRRIFDRRRQADSDSARPGEGPVRLKVADCEGLLEIEGAISELAGAAVVEARNAAGAGWSDDAVGTLLRRLVRFGTDNDRLALLDARAPRNGAPRRLAQALLGHRLLSAGPDGSLKLVHEAVLHHWPDAARWLESERRMLLLEGLNAFKARQWESQDREPGALARYGEHDIDDAAELLANWYDLLGDDEASPGDRKLRDFMLALLRAHPSPRRPVPASASGALHLHAAATYGDLDLIHAYLDIDPACADLPRQDGRTPLAAAAINGRTPVVQALLAAGADPDCPNQEGWRPLHVAAWAGQREAFEALLAAGASLVATREGPQAGLLYLAASNGHAELVERLLALGEDPARAAEDGWTALHAAAMDDHVDTIRLLATAGAPLEAQLADGGPTPLQIAAGHGRPAAILALAEAGAALDACAQYKVEAFRERQRWTALHIAVFHRQVEAARALLAAGAEGSPTNQLGNTPLHLALVRFHPEMATALLDGGVDPDAPAHDGKRCLCLMAHQGLAQQARLLLQHGATPDARNPGGRSALQAAAMEGHVDIVRMLLDAGADPGLRDDTGASALHHAARRGQAEIVALLLALPGSEADGTDHDGMTPLHHAAESGHPASMAKLARHGASPAASDLDGWTPLHLATLAGHDEAVRWLLANGAPVEAESRLPALRPLQLAAQLGHAGIAALLLAAGADPAAASRDEPAPLALAQQYRQDDVATLLRSALNLPPDGPDDGPANDRATGMPQAAAGPLSGLFNRGQGALRAVGDPRQTAAGPVDWHPELLFRTPASAALRARILNDPAIPAGLRAENLSVSVTPLPWYEGVQLVSLRAADWVPAGRGLHFALDRDDRLVRLAGISTPIHDLNGTGLRLDATTVLGYLRFFCFFVRGEHGPFYIVERLDDPMLPPQLHDAVRKVLRDTVRPAIVDGRDEQNRHVCEAVVWYGSALFVSTFSVEEAGNIEMTTDEPIAADLPLSIDAPLE